MERGDLTPVMAADGSGLPYELWRGLDVATLSRLISEIDIPPRSPALHQLWLRLITSNVTPPDGGVTDQQFLALRLEILYRSGLLRRPPARSPTCRPAIRPSPFSPHATRSASAPRIADAKRLKAGGAPAQLPKTDQGRCGADRRFLLRCRRRCARRRACCRVGARGRRQGEPRTAGARRHLDGGQSRTLRRTGDLPARLSANRSWPAARSTWRNVLKHGEPSLLAALALDAQGEPGLTLAAAEAAAHLNAISPQQLADIYRAQPSGAP